MAEKILDVHSKECEGQALMDSRRDWSQIPSNATQIVFETGCHDVAQADLNLRTLLPQPQVLELQVCAATPSQIFLQGKLCSGYSSVFLTLYYSFAASGSSVIKRQNCRVIKNSQIMWTRTGFVTN